MNDIQISQLKMVKLPYEIASKMGSTEHLTSDVSIGLEIETTKDPSIFTLIFGVENPKDADKSSIRGKYGKDIHQNIVFFAASLQLSQSLISMVFSLPAHCTLDNCTLVLIKPPAIFNRSAGLII